MVCKFKIKINYQLIKVLLIKKKKEFNKSNYKKKKLFSISPNLINKSNLLKVKIVHKMPIKEDKKFGKIKQLKNKLNYL
jgi:hypothetical protein